MPLYGPDPLVALETFEDQVQAMVLIGKDATIRVWLSDEVETTEQHEWALRQLDGAKEELIRMREGAVRN